MADLAVAHEILRQLGGPMFKMMTGAYNFVGSENSLSLRFKGSRQWNAMRIELTPMDVYKVTFMRIGPKTFKEEVHEDIYCDTLVELFERKTGLYTSL